MYLIVDYATAQASIAKAASEVEAVESTDKQGRGRPKTIVKNPAVTSMPFLVGPSVEQLACVDADQDEVDEDSVEAHSWVDDIIHGSICSSAGTSNGKINVKARAVIRALFLSEISAEACQTCEYSLRTAQRIAKACPTCCPWDRFVHRETPKAESGTESQNRRGGSILALTDLTSDNREKLSDDHSAHRPDPEEEG